MWTSLITWNRGRGWSSCGGSGGDDGINDGEGGGEEEEGGDKQNRKRKVIHFVGLWSDGVFVRCIL
ncbi:hypothetical protein Hanom_Chr14g01302041 [Helianthus anomalus]